ncbi:unnamed protein product [Owenia fusiformis]|uniref:Uncharacterized protein n=1 Tax=Owenia fusiformis TaxID=6347 RepID=A0A8S4NP73_OWEFU|nr:unnamed protein product [Owenia fusiformis]
MVYAFIISSLRPGPCTVLYTKRFGYKFRENYNEKDQIQTEGTEADIYKGQGHESENEIRRQQIAADTRYAKAIEAQEQHIGELVQSEYNFRKALSSKSFEEDFQRLNNDDVLPDLEKGCIRLQASKQYQLTRDYTVIWVGTLNCAFIFVCEDDENKQQAELTLKLIVKYIQQYTGLLNTSVTESLSRFGSTSSPSRIRIDRVTPVIKYMVPNGHLLVMNHRLVRQFEKELDVAMRN